MHFVQTNTVMLLCTSESLSCNLLPQKEKETKSCLLVLISATEQPDENMNKFQTDGCLGIYKQISNQSL